MTGRQAIEFQLRKLTKAIKMLRGEGLTLAALMVFYATIDSLAWLQRKNLNSDSTSLDSQAWVDSYLLPACDKNFPASSRELWGARCSLLHSQAAESKMSRKGEIREVWYRRKDFAFAPNVTDTQQRPVVVIDPDQLMDALEPATLSFLAALEGDERLEGQVEEQAKKWWVDLLLIPDTD